MKKFSFDYAILRTMVFLLVLMAYYGQYMIANRDEGSFKTNPVLRNETTLKKLTSFKAMTKPHKSKSKAKQGSGSAGKLGNLQSDETLPGVRPIHSMKMPAKSDKCMSNQARIRKLFFLQNLMEIPIPLQPLDPKRVYHIFHHRDLHRPPWKITSKSHPVLLKYEKSLSQHPAPSNRSCPNCFLNAMCYSTKKSLTVPSLGGSECEWKNILQFPDLGFNILFVGDSRMRRFFFRTVQYLASFKKTNVNKLHYSNQEITLWKASKESQVMYMLQGRYMLKENTLKRVITHFFPNATNLILLYGTSIHYEKSTTLYKTKFESAFVGMSTGLINLRAQGLIREIIHVDEIYPGYGTYCQYYYIKLFTRNWLKNNKAPVIIFDAYLFTADVYRELCYRYKAKSSVQKRTLVDPLAKANEAIIFHTSRIWNCQDRNHPGLFVMDTMAQQFLNHALKSKIYEQL